MKNVALHHYIHRGFIVMGCVYVDASKVFSWLTKVDSCSMEVFLCLLCVF